MAPGLRTRDRKSRHAPHRLTIFRFVSDLTRRLSNLAIVTAIAAMTLTPVASADTQTRSDPRGDTKGKPVGDAFDFRSAAVKHLDRRGTMRHRVVSWGRSGPRGVRLELDTDDRAGADYYVSKAPGKPAVVRNVYTNDRARARFKRHSRRSFSFAFNLGFAGNPAMYKWRWVTAAEGDQEFDAVPDSGFVRHRVIYGDPDD